MKKFRWHEMDNIELQEHEDVMGKEMADITNVQIAHPPIVPACVLNLIAQRHAELETTWFEVVTVRCVFDVDFGDEFAGTHHFCIMCFQHFFRCFIFPYLIIQHLII